MNILLAVVFLGIGIFLMYKFISQGRKIGFNYRNRTFSIIGVILFILGWIVLFNPIENTENENNVIPMEKIIQPQDKNLIETSTDSTNVAR